MLTLLDVAPIGIWGPIILVALLVAIPVILVIFFSVRALRRAMERRRDSEQ